MVWIQREKDRNSEADWEKPEKGVGTGIVAARHVAAVPAAVQTDLHLKKAHDMTDQILASSLLTFDILVLDIVWDMVDHIAGHSQLAEDTTKYHFYSRPLMMQEQAAHKTGTVLLGMQTYHEMLGHTVVRGMRSADQEVVKSAWQVAQNCDEKKFATSKMVLAQQVLKVRKALAGLGYILAGTADHVPLRRLEQEQQYT